MTRKLLTTVAVVSALLLTFASATVANARTTPAASSSDAGGFWIARSGHQSLSDAIQEKAAFDPAFRAVAVKVVSKWVDQAKAGKKVELASSRDNGSAAQQLPHLTTLLHGLNAGTSPTATSQSSVFSTAVVQPATLLNPNYFAVRGYPGSARTYWEQMSLENVGEFCSNSCSVTDDLTLTVTVNPGARSSYVQWSRSGDRFVELREPEGLLRPRPGQDKRRHMRHF
jgi:hypothetical protein